MITKEAYDRAKDLEKFFLPLAWATGRDAALGERGMFAIATIRALAADLDDARKSITALQARVPAAGAFIEGAVIPNAFPPRNDSEGSAVSSPEVSQ